MRRTGPWRESVQKEVLRVLANSRLLMAEPRSIGSGWVESVDPGTQRKYYANTITKATSWTWPEDVPKETAEWTSAVDPSTGKVR